MNLLLHDIELKLRQISKMLGVHHNIVAQSPDIVNNDFRHATMDVLMGTINELSKIQATLVAEAIK
jgi:hypothetical protein